MGRWLVVVAAAVLASPGVAGVAQAQSRLPQFLDARSAGVAAAGAGDLKAAETHLAQADALIPNHPVVLQMRARVAAAEGRTGDAVAHWARYAALGLIARPESAPQFSAVVADPAYAPVRARFADNAAPVGRLDDVATITLPLVAESLVRDTARGRLLVSAVRGRTILQVDDAGQASPWLDPGAEVAGIPGLALDEARGVMWATASGLPVAKPLPGALTDRSELLMIDLSDGRIVRRWRQPDDLPRSFGDLALAPDGSVYVSDSTGGTVFRLPPSGEALETLIPAGSLRSPQGMAVAPNGRDLVISDYTSGLYRLDPEAGEVFPLAAPDVSLIGIDALIRTGDSLIAVQNGTNPQRILRLRLDSEATTVVEAEVVAANLPQVDEPTGAVWTGTDLLLIAASQWSAYDDDGAERRPPPPVRIVRLTPP